MYDTPYDRPDAPKRRRPGLKIALVSAGVAAGAICATAVGASAVSSTPTGTTGSSGSNSPNLSAKPPAGGHGGARPIRSDEKAVSSSDTATIKAAALKAVPGGKVYRIETDAGDGAYEAHMTKADGTAVTVKFDKNLKVTKVEAGMGTGDRAPAGAAGRGGRPPNGAPTH